MTMLAKVLDQLNSMSNLGAGDFKAGYAATAIPVRYSVEQSHWDRGSEDTTHSRISSTCRRSCRVGPRPGPDPQSAASRRKHRD